MSTPTASEIKTAIAAAVAALRDSRAALDAIKADSAPDDVRAYGHFVSILDSFGPTVSVPHKATKRLQAAWKFAVAGILQARGEWDNTPQFRVNPDHPVAAILAAGSDHAAAQRHLTNLRQEFGVLA